MTIGQYQTFHWFLPLLENISPPPLPNMIIYKWSVLELSTLESEDDTDANIPKNTMYVNASGRFWPEIN